MTTKRDAGDELSFLPSPDHTMLVGLASLVGLISALAASTLHIVTELLGTLFLAPERLLELADPSSAVHLLLRDELDRVRLVEPIGGAVIGLSIMGLGVHRTRRRASREPAGERARKRSRALLVGAVLIGAALLYTGLSYARCVSVAIDSEGMLWVANLGGGDVTMVDPTNAATTHFGAGFLTGPWGIAVDGADNVWVADFFGRRVVQICGASGDCPSGFTTGQVITPPAGYVAAGGMQHITDVAIDPSGNVWLANNNHDQPRCDAPPPLDSPPSVELDIQSMSCGGNGVVVLFGVAAGVATAAAGASPARRGADPRGRSAAGLEALDEGDVLRAGLIRAHPLAARPRVPLGAAAGVEHARALAGDVPLAGLLVEPIELEQDVVARSLRKVLHALGRVLELFDGRHRSSRPASLTRSSPSSRSFCGSPPLARSDEGLRPRR